LFTIPKMDNDPLSVARFGAKIAGHAVADARNAGFRRRWPGGAERDITRALRRVLKATRAQVSSIARMPA
jgi:hypothetical protein